MFGARIKNIWEEQLVDPPIHDLACVIVPWSYYWVYSLKKIDKVPNLPTRGQFHKLIYAQRQTICLLCPTFEKLFTGAKVQHNSKWKQPQEHLFDSLLWYLNWKKLPALGFEPQSNRTQSKRSNHADHFNNSNYCTNTYTLLQQLNPFTNFDSFYNND